MLGLPRGCRVGGGGAADPTAATSAGAVECAASQQENTQYNTRIVTITLCVNVINSVSPNKYLHTTTYRRERHTSQLDTTIIRTYKAHKNTIYHHDLLFFVFFDIKRLD